MAFTIVGIHEESTAEGDKVMDAGNGWYVNI
jgi:hypothetical protein